MRPSDRSLLLCRRHLIGLLAQEIHEFLAFAGGGERFRGDGLANMNRDDSAYTAFHLSEDQRQAKLNRHMTGPLEQT